MIFGLVHQIQGGRAHPLVLTFMRLFQKANPATDRHVATSLAIGIQTFRQIRKGDYYYVDKTGFALRLIDESKY